jgi:purine-nucleoside phosphorylase
MYQFDKLSRIELEEAADFLARELPFIHSVDLVVQLGSGLSSDNLLDEEWNRVRLQNMPHLPTEESLASHRFDLIWGTCGDHRVLVLAGRFHIYEGYGRLPCILPIFAACHCGARNFVITNAAGSVRERMAPGSFMLIADHINNLGVSALAGHQHLLGSPYVDMSETYSPEFITSFSGAAAKENVTVHTGVYMANTGPQFETPAEVLLAQQMGADAVGMSTVLEATLAHAFGAKVLGVSMITNWGAGLGRDRILHDQAIEVGRDAGQLLIASIRRWVIEDAALSL